MRTRISLALVLFVLGTVGCAGPQVGPFVIDMNDDDWIVQAKAEALLLLMSPQLNRGPTDQESYAASFRPVRFLDPGKDYLVEFGDKVDPAERANVMKRVRAVSARIRPFDRHEAGSDAVRYRADVAERHGGTAVLIGGDILIGSADSAFYTFVYVKLGGRPYLTAINLVALAERPDTSRPPEPVVRLGRAARRSAGPPFG